MKTKNILSASLLFMAVSCGPSHQDKLTANLGCQVIESYEEAENAIPDSKSFKQEVMVNTMNYYLDNLKDANLANVRSVMEDKCGDKLDLFDKIMSN